jgi:hypothetical protein
MDDPILRRILRQTGDPRLVETLAHRLSLTDLQSLLLAVYRERAMSRRPSDLLALFAENAFVRPAGPPPAAFMEFDRLAFELLPGGFEALELSPLCPLGTHSAVAPVSQNNVVTTVRNTELCADATNVLALECARRRAGRPSASAVRLCASHRQVRGQRFNEPGAYQHFKVLALCTAGRDTGDFRFEAEALIEHIDFYIRLLDACPRLELRPSNVRTNFAVHEDGLRDWVRDRILAELASRHPRCSFGWAADSLSGHGYYTRLRFMIEAAAPAGTVFLIADGGFTDWTRRLLSDGKERLLASGIGTERLITCFGKAGP